MSHSSLGLEDRIEKSLHVLKEDLNAVRAGRANPAILDKISVDYYGCMTPLKSLANVSVPDPRTLMIVPFDTSAMENIEKAINVANLGINPNNDGKCIRLSIPVVTEERRKELLKDVKKLGEECKVAVRNIRREENDKLKKQEKSNEITEDELKDGLENNQKAIDHAGKEIDSIIESKDKEIMEV
ncbi:MAG: ribosome recycling factor [Peptostreptococcaceae bacterium]|nr:ribosome recycling factor [Peptostreptococcaceae bacterium]